MKAVLLWLSDPANIVLLGTIFGFVLSVAKNVAQALKATRAVAVIDGLQADRATGTATIVALVQGGEKIKAALDLERGLHPLDELKRPKTDSKAVSRAMQAEAVAAGVEHVLGPIVTAVQAETPSSLVIRKATDRFDAAHVVDPKPPGAAP